MKLLAQHGWGKSNKIESAINAGSVEGAIMSPRDEKPENLEAYLSNNIPAGSTVFIDPQLYAIAESMPNLGKLDLYPFSQSVSKKDLQTASKVANLVRVNQDYQRSLSVSHICSPNIKINALSDQTSTVSNSLMLEAVEEHSNSSDTRPLLCSVVVNQNALLSTDELNGFLDTLTAVECSGFYILVDRGPNQLGQTITPTLLANWMYLIHVLSELNGYEVIVGYVDFIGLALSAAGASAVAGGWYQSLRRFGFDRFRASTGGQPPRDRYTSLPLFNLLDLANDMDQIAAMGEINNVLTGTPYDGVLARSQPSSADWPKATAALHHWASLSKGLKSLERQSDLSLRIDELEEQIRKANELYQRLETSGMRFHQSSAEAHLKNWTDGISEFKVLSGI